MGKIEVVRGMSKYNRHKWNYSICVSIKSVVPSIIIIWRNLVWAVHLGVECSSRPRKSGMIVRLSQFYIGIYRDIRAFRPYQLLSMQLEHYSTYIPVLYLFWFCILCCCNTVLIKLPGVLMRIRYKKKITSKIKL